MIGGQSPGELGDLVDELVPIAAELVQAVRDEGPAAVRGILAGVPHRAGEEIPAWDALAVVLAAMVNPDAGIRSLLGWAEEMLPEPPLPPLEPTPTDRERTRLRTAGVGSRDATETLAGPVAALQQTTRDRMLHIVHGGRQTA